MINVAILNESTVVTADQIHAMSAAMQKQANEHFAPIWHVEPVTLTVVKDSPTAGVLPAPSVDTWWLVILDDSDQADALGYHDLTNSGRPIAKVFAKSDIADGAAVSVTASHELLEMLGDPQINTAVDVNGNGTLFMAYEAADACEDDRYAYLIDGVKVTDFVTPEWFRNFLVLPNAKFDYCGKITKPLQLLSGGYISQYTSTSGWTQTTNMSRITAKMTPKLGSRRERRVRGQNNWKLSTVGTATTILDSAAAIVDVIKQIKI